MAKLRKYTDYLYEELEDPEFAEGYLNECLKDEDLEVFLLAIQDVAKAKKVKKTYFQKQKALINLLKTQQHLDSQATHFKELVENGVHYIH